MGKANYYKTHKDVVSRAFQRREFIRGVCMSVCACVCLTDLLFSECPCFCFLRKASMNHMDDSVQMSLCCRNTDWEALLYGGTFEGMNWIRVCVREILVAEEWRALSHFNMKINPVIIHFAHQKPVIIASCLRKEYAGKKNCFAKKKKKVATRNVSFCVKKGWKSSSVSRVILTSEDEVFWRGWYYPNLRPLVDKRERLPTQQQYTTDAPCLKA